LKSRAVNFEAPSKMGQYITSQTSTAKCKYYIL
jgi:hypothetical protein